MARHYGRKDLDFVFELYSNNAAFKKITDEIVSSFDLSEIAVLKHGINTINEMQGINNQSYIDLILIITQTSKDEVNQSPETERLRVFCEMIREVGFDDAWSNEPIEPTVFLNKISKVFDYVHADP